MNPTMKRYKNQISIISKQMNDLLKNHAYFKENGYNRRSRRDHSLQLNLDSSLYEAHVRYDIILTNPKLKTVESDGLLFFGIDLNQSVKLKLRTPFNSDEERYIGIVFLDAVLPSWDKPRQPIASEVFNDLVYKGVLDHSMSSDSFTRESGHRKGITDKEILMQSDYFEEFKQDILSLPSSASLSMELKSGEFPRLSDRHLFPFLWLDLESGMINYCCDARAESYRQGRNTVRLDNFIVDPSTRENAAYLIKPFFYIDLDISHRSIKNIRVYT